MPTGLWVYRPIPYGVAKNYISVEGSASEIIPVSGNYGGFSPNLIDFVTWKKTTGNWTIRYNGGSPGNTVIQWGLSTDIPIAGDFDRDGIADITVWRNSYQYPGAGGWFVIPSSGNCPPHIPSVGTYCLRQYGLPGDDIPVQ